MSLTPAPTDWNRVLAILQLDPCREGLQIANASSTTSLVPTQPALVCGRGPGVPSKLVATYPIDHPARLVAGQAPVQAIEAPLSRLIRRLEAEAEDWALYLPPLRPEEAAGSFDSLKSIVARLRAPGGCPWDREQTHESLKATLLEEAYEVLEALDSGDRDRLREELGDLLMQVMIHTQIAEEAGEFDMAQVVGGIGEKLVRRHPHVFGDTEARTAQEVMVNWEAIKRTERPPGASSLSNVPRQMPALAFAQAVQQRVARQGFDWQNVEGVVDKVAEEVRELVESESADERLHEIGDLFFSLVNLARWLGLEAEESLRLSNERFIRRFSFIEEVCRERGCQLKDLSFDEQDTLWEMAKERTR